MFSGGGQTSLSSLSDVGSKNNSKKKSGFTLAEVLITLGIIGIVAAMTMPSVINNIQTKELEVRFKKVYSNLLNIHSRMIADYDNVYENFIIKDLYSSADDAANERKNIYIDAFMSYVSGGRKCTYANSFLSCSGNKSIPASYKTYDGKRTAHLSADTVLDKAIVTNSGMTFFFGNSQWRNSRIYVDTNGSAKGPNRLGFDLFAFDVDKTDKIVPAKNTASNVDDDGNVVSVNECSIKKGNTAYNGFGCSQFALINKNPDKPNLAYWENLPK